MHSIKNKWSPSWARYWFYAKVHGINRIIDDEVKTMYHFASRLVDSNPDRMPEFARHDHGVGERFTLMHTISPAIMTWLRNSAPSVIDGVIC